MKNLKVYIAGPYTQGDPAVNVANAVRAADELLRAGFIPYIPHLTHFWHMMHPHLYEDWIKLDLEWLKVCNIMVRLPGASPGADIEEKEARKLLIGVYTVEEAIKEYG
jgi:hypothetical protein